MRKMKRYLPVILVVAGLILGGCAWLLRPLQAKLTATPTSGPAPLSVTFSAAQSTGPITSFTLDFGDGSTPYSGTDLTVNISHTYQNPGTYTAVLTVASAQGATASDSVVIQVLPGTQASLSASPSTVEVGGSVTFTLSATAASGRTLVSWTLDFGDGQTQSGAVSGSTMNITLTHTYSAAGTYDAVLTVQDSAGFTATAQVTITVTSPPPPEITSFTATDGTTTVSEGGTLSITSGTQVIFAFTAQAGPGRKLVKWNLAFGDGFYTGQDGLNVSTLSVPNITHTYTATQTQAYTATLKVWDDLNNSDTATITIEVTP